MQKLLLVYYYSQNRATNRIWKVLPNMVFPPMWGKNGGVLSMRMQVILDSSSARPGSFPIRGGKKGEFRDWTMGGLDGMQTLCNLRFISQFFIFLWENFKNQKHFHKQSVSS